MWSLRNLRVVLNVKTFCVAIESFYSLLKLTLLYLVTYANYWYTTLRIYDIGSWKNN